MSGTTHYVVTMPQRPFSPSARLLIPDCGPERSAPYEIEGQGLWKQGGGMVGRYTRGESAGSALRYL